MRSWLQASVVVLWVFSTSHAKPDGAWHLPLIGPLTRPLPGQAPLHRFQHFRHAATLRNATTFVTLTEKGVLASVDPSSGALQWRRSAVETNQVSATKSLQCGDRLLLLTKVNLGWEVQSVSIDQGLLHWRHVISSLVQSPARETIATSDIICWSADEAAEPDVVVAISGGELQRLRGFSGEVMWTRSYNPGIMRLAHQNNLLLVLHMHKDASFFEYIEPELGSIAIASRRTSFSCLLDVDSPQMHVLLGEPAPMALWLEDGVLRQLTLAEESANPTTFRGRHKFRSIEDIGLLSQGMALATRADGTAALFSARSDGSLFESWSFSDLAEDSLFAGYTSRRHDIYVSRLSYSPTLQMASLQILSLSPSNLSPGPVLRGHTFPLNRLDSGSVVTYCLEVSALPEDKLATRIILTTESGSIEQWEGAHLTWRREEGITSLSSHPLLLPDVDVARSSKMGLATSTEAFGERVQRHLNTLSHIYDNNQPIHEEKSSYQPQPYAVLASLAHRTVYGLALGKSISPIWRFIVPPSPGEQSIDKLTLESSDAASVTVVAEEHGPSRKSRNRLSLTTGQLLDDSTERKPAPVAKLEASIIDNHTLVIHQVSANRYTELWSLNMGASIIGLANPCIDAVASLGRVLGNRQTMTKYLNPNLLAVTTSSEKSVLITLLDSLSGQRLHTISHLREVDLDQGVDVVLQDNWLVYTFVALGDPSLATRVVSVELYHPVDEENALRVVSRSFVSIDRARIIGMTKTKLGITTTNAIMRSSANQMWAVPRRVLDPRRPYDKPSKADAEEMLLPYEAALSLDPKWALFRGQALLGPTNILVTNGGLESESRILAFGLDVLTSTVSPSRSFDVLSPSFNKLQLLVTLSVLSSALLATRTMVRQRLVRQRWYSQKV